MDYRLSQNDRELIRETARELFLGLILVTGDIQIKVADPLSYIGHNEWVARDGISLSNVNGGFSFIVKDGKVIGFFPSSQLNRTPDWKLPKEQTRAILELLPLSDEFQIY